MHFNLQTMITSKISYLNVRDIFKNIAFDVVSIKRIMLLAFESQIKIALKKKTQKIVQKLIEEQFCFI
jgi:hypothetical protein